MSYKGGQLNTEKHYTIFGKGYMFRTFQVAVVRSMIF